MCLCSQATASTWQDALGSPRAWFPGQHTLARQLKRFPVGGLCLHVHDGRRALGRPSQAGDFCLSLCSQSGKAHICFLSFFD